MSRFQLFHRESEVARAGADPAAADLYAVLERFREAVVGNGSLWSRYETARDYASICFWAMRRLEYSFVARTFAKLEGEADGALRVLDVGSGVVPLASWVAGRGHKTVAIDPLISDMLYLSEAETAAPLHPVRPRYGAAQAERLPFADGSFDVALLVSVLEHVTPGNDQVVLAEIARVLKPGGWLVLTFDVAPPKEPGVGELDLPKDHRRYGEPFTEASARTLLERMSAHYEVAAGDTPEELSALRWEDVAEFWRDTQEVDGRSEPERFYLATGGVVHRREAIPAGDNGDEAHAYLQGQAALRERVNFFEYHASERLQQLTELGLRFESIETRLAGVEGGQTELTESTTRMSEQAAVLGNETRARFESIDDQFGQAEKEQSALVEGADAVTQAIESQAQAIESQAQAIERQTEASERALADSEANLRDELGRVEAHVQESVVPPALFAELIAVIAEEKQLAGGLQALAAAEEQLRDRVTEHRRTVELLEQSFETSREQQHELESDLVAKEEMIRDLERHLDLRSTSIEELHESLKVRELEAIELRERSEELDNLQSELDERQEVIDELVEERERKRRITDEVQRHGEELEAVVRRADNFRKTSILYWAQASWHRLSLWRLSIPFTRSAALIRRWSRPRLGKLVHHPPIELTIPKSYTRGPSPRPEELPSISIVTPSFNQAHFLERTMKSVLDQEYPELEYRVQDGASTDGTPELLELYEPRLASAVSEPDGGQAEAINRAFSHTSGEVMAYLNSDDLILPGSLAYVGAYLARHPEVDVVYGHRVLIDAVDREIGRWVLPPHDQDILNWADYIPQETLFWRRSLWEKTGASMDESFQFALDWDLVLRFQEAGARFRRLPRFLGAFRIHDTQKTSANISDVGHSEMQQLRKRQHGRAIPHEETAKAVRPYLKRSVIWHNLYRAGVFRY